jgi:hypothetical protein
MRSRLSEARNIFADYYACKAMSITPIGRKSVAVVESRAHSSQQPAQEAAARSYTHIDECGFLIRMAEGSEFRTGQIVCGANYLCICFGAGFMVANVTTTIAHRVATKTE